jgi:Glyoxalase-like domain
MIDHLVYATPDLAASVAALTAALGVVPTPGGVHPGRGTRNELVHLGWSTYLEIVGPDTSQPDPPGGRPFGIDDLTRPALVAWCVRPTDALPAVAARAADVGWDVGRIEAMSRSRTDGILLSWHLTMPTIGPNGIAALPFLIDWETSAHPTASLPTGPTLQLLTIECPQPDTVRTCLAAVGDFPSVTARTKSATRLFGDIVTSSGHFQLT